MSTPKLYIFSGEGIPGQVLLEKTLQASKLTAAVLARTYLMKSKKARPTYLPDVLCCDSLFTYLRSAEVKVPTGNG